MLLLGQSVLRMPVRALSSSTPFSSSSISFFSTKTGENEEEKRKKLGASYTEFMRKQAARRLDQRRRAETSRLGKFPRGSSPLYVAMTAKPQSPWTAKGERDAEDEEEAHQRQLTSFDDTHQGKIDKMLEKETRKSMSKSAHASARRFAAKSRGEDYDDDDDHRGGKGKGKGRGRSNNDNDNDNKMSRTTRTRPTTTSRRDSEMTEEGDELEDMRQRDKELKVREKNFALQRQWTRQRSEYCPGCGAKVQSEDPLGIGYVAKDRMEAVRTQPLFKKAKEQAEWMTVGEAMLRRQNLTVEELYPDGKVHDDDHDPTVFRSLRDLEREHGGVAQERSSVCQRCHELRTDQLDKVGSDLAWQSPDSVRKKLRQMFGHRKFLAVVVVDLAHFEASFIRNIEQFVGGNRVLLVGNKFDLLPAGANEERVRVWLKARAEEFHLKNIRRTLVLSAETGEGMRSLCAEIEELRGADDVVMIGATNVGKTTMFNGLVPRMFPGAKTQATSSALPGTTLQCISFPFDGASHREKAAAAAATATATAAENSNSKALKLKPNTNNNNNNNNSFSYDYQQDTKTQSRLVEDTKKDALTEGPKLIDTPGLVLYDNIDHLLRPTELRSVQIRRRIRPKIFRLVEGKTIFFGGLARVDYVRGAPLYLTAFVSRNLAIHPSSIERADDLYARQKGTLLAPPTAHVDEPRRLERFPKLEPVRVVVNTADVYDLKSWRTAFADISIGGIGWVSLTGGTRNQDPCEFHVHVPEGVSVAVRKALMPFEAEPTKRKSVQKHGKVDQKAVMHPLTRRTK